MAAGPCKLPEVSLTTNIDNGATGVAINADARSIAHKSTVRQLSDWFHAKKTAQHALPGFAQPWGSYMIEVLRGLRQTNTLHGYSSHIYSCIAKLLLNAS